jgi:hypothetical protein
MTTPIWDHDKLREAWELALELGEARFTLPTAHDADRFRSAMYNHRRYKNGNVGKDFVIEVKDCEVVLRRVETAPEITVVNQDGTEKPLGSSTDDAA